MAHDSGWIYRVPHCESLRGEARIGSSELSQSGVRFYNQRREDAQSALGMEGRQADLQEGA